jgi:CheY-like chemotaxis protein
MTTTDGDGARREGEGPLRVLLVDDDPELVDILAEALDLMGFATRIARDGLEALRADAEFVPHVALIDLSLPELDGYQVATRLLRTRGERRLRLVAISGYGHETERRRSIEAGFDAHLVKPAPLEAITELLHRLGEAPPQS